MIETELITLTKRTDAPSTESSDWSEQLLCYLLTWLSKGEKPFGAVFAEFYGPTPIDIKLSPTRENFLTKTQEHKVVYTVNLNNYLRFVTYLGKQLLGLEIGTMGCGIVRVKFDDEDEERLFTLYLRRSSKLPGFFQLDQFKRHL